MSLPLRLVLRFTLTIALVFGLSRAMPDRFFVGGGVPGFIIIGALLTLLQIFVRPLLKLLTLPLRLLLGGIAWILASALLLLALQDGALLFDPAIVSLTVTGDLRGWFTVALALGLAMTVIDMITD